MRILLIRHGRTEANEKAMYCGISDLPLSENGIESLKSRREIYKNYRSVKQRYFTSGLKRANMTLEILFEEDGVIPEYNVLSNFREINFGKFELHTYEELKDDPEYIEWISQEFGIPTPPGGESGVQMAARVQKAFELLIKELQNESSDAVLVCHGGTIHYLMKYLFPEEKKTIYEWQPPGGDGYILTLDDNQTWSYEKIGTWQIVDRNILK